VVERMRLLGGEPWSMPIVLDVSESQVEDLKEQDKILLVDGKGKERFVLEDVGCDVFNKKEVAGRLFGTNDEEHPGVGKVMNKKDFVVSGRLAGTEDESRFLKAKSYLKPEETRRLFKDRGWGTVVAFQTRNAPHRSHEHLQLKALELTDGLFVNPIIGPKKDGDFKDEYILGAYKILVKSSGLKEKMLLGTLHTYMRYAGPKEAVFHALVRKNFGCTHMIIGRDHAGVGNYYGTYEAQKIFDSFTARELGIKILKYENAFYCRDCQGVVFEGQCEHDESQRIFVSGTELRQKLSNGERIPVEFMRKEVTNYLLKNKDKLFVQS
jgi:sulfate adenylyltransferase